MYLSRVSQGTTSSKKCLPSGYRTSSSYYSKTTTNAHQPYVVATGSDFGFISIHLNFHFLKGLREVLAGTTAGPKSSPVEQELYEDYLSWMSDDRVYTGLLLSVLEEIDYWLVQEIQGLEHVDHAVPTPEFSN